MSYDLLVFDAAAAPNEPIAFLAWYKQFTQWQEPCNYDDPANSTETLRAWYRAMIRKFPAMNGPDAKGPSFFDGDKITGYTCGREAIYVDFRWSVASKAHAASFELAKKHKLGFWDVSSSLDVWAPVNETYAVQFKVTLA